MPCCKFTIARLLLASVATLQYGGPMPTFIKNRGKLLLGARPIARHAFKDESRWRSLYNDEMQRALGLFMLGNRLAGYTGVIDAWLSAKITAALAGEREATAAAVEITTTA